MRLKSNPIAKVLTLSMVLAVGYLIIQNDGGNASTSEKGGGDGPPPLSQESAVESGLQSSDASALRILEERMRDLSDSVEDIGDSIDGGQDGNTKVLKSNEEQVGRLKSKVVELEEAIKLLKEERNTSDKGFQDRVMDVFDSLELKSVGASSVGDVNDVVSSSNPFSSDYIFEVGKDTNKKEESANASGYVWTKPVSQSSGSVKDGIEELFGKTANGTESDEKNIESAIPYITLPKGSRFENSTTLDALIGRIGSDEQGGIDDPYEFQALLSADSLLANGFRVSEVKNAMATGVAYGDANFRCVRGKITDITFIFTDGRIVSFSGSFDEPLGKLRDEFGSPCIQGTYVDNVSELITSQSILGGVGALAELAQNEQETISNSLAGTTSNVTGDRGTYLGAGFANGAITPITDIINKRARAYHAAIYREQGVNISIVLDQQLAIDYNEENRKVRYVEDTQALYNNILY